MCYADDTVSLRPDKTCQLTKWTEHIADITNGKTSNFLLLLISAPFISPSLSATLTWENLHRWVSGGRLWRQMACPGWAGGHTAFWRTTAHEHPQTHIHTNYTSEHKNTNQQDTNGNICCIPAVCVCVFVWPFISSLSQECLQSASSSSKLLCG